VEVNQLTGRIIGAAIEVHRELGPGKLESVYELALLPELQLRGITCQSQRPVPVVYKGIKLDCGYRLDILAEGQVVVEVKAVEAFNRLHLAQVITYLKLGGWNVGLLLNFNVDSLKNGLRRVVMGLGMDTTCRFESAPRQERQALATMTPGGRAFKYSAGDLQTEAHARAVIATAVDVHRELGPGLLVSAYDTCLCHELSCRGIPFERHRALPLSYKGLDLRVCDDIRLIVGGCLLVTPLAVATILPVHQMELISQLRLGRWELGLLLNFCAPTMTEGIRRVVLNLQKLTHDGA
jgi:GxxExxY protein